LTLCRGKAYTDNSLPKKDKKMTKSQQLLYQVIKEQDQVEDKTKLAKLEYFADFIHYAFNDKPISEETNVYTKVKQGPLSRTFNEDLNTLKQLGIVEEKPRYNFRIKKDIKTLLTKRELRTIRYVLKKYGGLSYSDLIHISHSQAPYLSTKDGGIVEFFTAYNLVDEYPDYCSYVS